MPKGRICRETFDAYRKCTATQFFDVADLDGQNGYLRRPTTCFVLGQILQQFFAGEICPDAVVLGSLSPIRSWAVMSSRFFSF